MDLPTTAQNALNNLRTAARKDPKKATVLAALVVVMGGMWVKLLTKSEPASAAGAIRPPAGASAANGGAAAGGATASDKARTGYGGGGARTAAWSSGKLVPVTRNLFLVEYDRYPQAGQSTAAGNPVQQSAEAATEAAKSGPSPADLRKERQILITNLQQQASQLKLQTTVMGASPKALVNGSLVGEGDVVASFRIVKITNRGMVIEREGIRLDVQMK